jgi:hypothetical protein
MKEISYPPRPQGRAEEGQAMGEIRFASPEDTPQIIPNDVVSGLTEEQAMAYSDGSQNVLVRRYHPGSDTELQMFEVTMRPNDVAPVHAHEESEIIYVTAGELRFGRRVLRAGSSVFITGRTLYKFEAGAEGVTFLNFRPRQDLSIYTKEDIAAGPSGEGR